MRKLLIAPIALYFPDNVAEFLTYGEHKIQAFTGNKDLANPVPTIQVVTADFDGLGTAEAAVKSRGPDAVPLRDQLLGACRSDMEQWATYARATALANPARAKQILASSGFLERPPTARKKGDFEVTFPAPGVAHVWIRAVKRGASYEWMISLDGGLTFVSAGTTTRADQLFSNLKRGTDYQVKWRVTVGHAMSDWTQGYHFMQAK